MLQIRTGKNPEGKPIISIVTEEVIEPLPVLRALKQSFPDLWQQVSRELFLPNQIDTATLEQLGDAKP